VIVNCVNEQKLFVVTTCRCLINPIINPTPRLSHCTRDNIIYLWWSSENANLLLTAGWRQTFSLPATFRIARVLVTVLSALSLLHACDSHVQNASCNRGTRNSSVKLTHNSTETKYYSYLIYMKGIEKQMIMWLRKVIYLHRVIYWLFMTDLQHVCVCMNTSENV
jgi:hypothetical protein